MSKTRACTLERLVDGFDQTLANDIDGGANGGYTYQDRPSLVELDEKIKSESTEKQLCPVVISCFLPLVTLCGKILLSASRISAFFTEVKHG
jgi:hypothetical protein